MVDIGTWLTSDGTVARCKIEDDFFHFESNGSWIKTFLHEDHWPVFAEFYEPMDELAISVLGDFAELAKWHDMGVSLHQFS